MSSISKTPLRNITIVHITQNNRPPAKRMVPSTLQKLQQMQSPKKNPLLEAVKQFADNPARLQEELQKLLREGHENVCNYLLDILSLHCKNTVEHTKGVARVATKFAGYLGLSLKKTEEIKVAALTHDIGKLYTPLNVLNKPGRLNEAEWVIMSEHAPLGEKLLNQLKLTNIHRYFKKASRLAATHNSHTSVSPTSKKPIEEEIIELCDVFNALTKKRPYHKAKTPQEVLIEMNNIQKKENLWSPHRFDKFKRFIAENYIKKPSANKLQTTV